MNKTQVHTRVPTLTEALADLRYVRIIDIGVTVQPYNANTTLLGNSVTGTGALVRETAPTLVTPTIASLTNAQHTHQNAAGGGSLDAAAIGSGVLANARVNFATPDPIGSTTPNTIAATFLSATVTDTGTATAVDVEDIVHAISSGTPAAGFGAAQRFRGHTATPANGLRTFARIRAQLLTATDATYTSRLIFSTFRMVAGVPTETDAMYLGTDGVWSLGTTPATSVRATIDQGSLAGQALYVNVTDTSTTLAGTSAQQAIVMRNKNATNNNWTLFSFEHAGQSISAMIGTQNIDQTNAYAEVVFATRATTGFAERMRINHLGIDVRGETIRLRTAKTPASAAAAGNQGDICWDSGFFYICVSTNSWRRVAHAAW